MRFSALPPRAAVTRIASRMSGNAIWASAKRMIACSTAPPRSPATMPATLPITAENSMELMPTRKERLAP